MNYTYAGIGSRETPSDICYLMTNIARKLDDIGLILHSGGADGADEAFEKGAFKKKIFLPWSGFNNKKEDGYSYIVPKYEESLIQKYHPGAQYLKQGAMKLMSRNSYQVLGSDLQSPVDFVICWTKDGKASGGTGQALRIAEAYTIPVFNLKRPDDLRLLGQFIIENYGIISN